MTFNNSTSVDHTDDVFKSWDNLGIEEQRSLQAFYKSKDLPLGSFHKEMQALNQYITQDGPVIFFSSYLFGSLMLEVT